MVQDTEVSFQNTNEERYIFYWERKNTVSMSIGSYKRLTSKEGQTIEKSLTWNFKFLHEEGYKTIWYVCATMCVFLHRLVCWEI